MSTMAGLSYRQIASPSGEQGIALVTALVFLIIATVISLGSMRGSGLELQMSGNVQDQGQAFQGAESGIAFTLRREGFLSTGINPGDSELVDTSKSRTRVTTRTRYLGEGRLSGQSLAEVSSIDSTSVHIFHVDSRASFNNARARVGRGIRRIGPRAEN